MVKDAVLHLCSRDLIKGNISIFGIGCLFALLCCS